MACFGCSEFLVPFSSEMVPCESTSSSTSWIIKGDAADFRVVEVDVNGVLVPTTASECRHYKHPVPISQAPNEAARREKEHQRTLIKILSREELAMSIGVEQVDRVHHLYESCKIEWLDHSSFSLSSGQLPVPLVSDTSNTMGPLLCEISLDEVLSKSDRGSIRCTIAYLYPGITTHYNAEKAATTLQLHRHPRLCVYRDAFGLENALRILQYCASCSVLGTPPLRVPFLTSASKVEKRLVHEGARSDNLQLEVRDGMVKISRKGKFPAPPPPLGLDKDTTGSGGLSSSSPHDPTSVSNRSNFRFFHAVLLKQNMSGFEAKKHVANFFCVAPTAVGTAGIKDKRAFTAQRISCPVTPKALRKLSQLMPSVLWESAAPSTVEEEDTVRHTASANSHETSKATPTLPIDDQKGEEEDKKSVITVMESVDGNVFVRLLAVQLMPGPIRTGEHRGNQFRIAVRRSGGEDGDTKDSSRWKVLFEKLQSRVRDVAAYGCPNYFGPQRFGNWVPSAEGSEEDEDDEGNDEGGGDPANDCLQSFQDILPGIHILRGDYDQAIDSLFMGIPNTTGNENILAVKQAFMASVSAQQQPTKKRHRAEDGQVSAPAASRSTDAGKPFYWKETFEKLSHQTIPSNLKDIKEVQLQLKRYDMDAKKALAAMPYDTRQLWLHAAQSLVFNFILSAKLKAFHHQHQHRKKKQIEVSGFSFVPSTGDWVIAENDDVTVGKTVVETVNGSTYNNLNKKLVAPLLGAGTPVQALGLAAEEQDEAILASCSPLLETSDNKDEPETMACITKRVLGNLNVTVAQFQQAQPLGVSLAGSFRPLVIVPESLRICSTETELRTKGLLMIEMQLPPSAYATVVLREILAKFPA